MKPDIILTHEFVEHAPRDMREGTIYISIAYKTVLHKCCCGCGTQIVTPLSPAEWKLIFDGQTVTLEPSIGNWSLPCQAHYWIKNNRVIWAERWSKKRIGAARMRDAIAKERQLFTPSHQADDVTEKVAERPTPSESQRGLWRKLKKWWW
jgi:hypothetical protein